MTPDQLKEWGETFDRLWNEGQFDEAIGLFHQVGYDDRQRHIDTDHAHPDAVQGKVSHICHSFQVLIPAAR